LRASALLSADPPHPFPSNRRLHARGVASLVACSLSVAVRVTVGAEAPHPCTWERLHPTGTISSGKLQESSGLAASGRHADLLWSINDSGNPPVLYALDMAGRDLGSFAVVGAQNRDWEDLAAFDVGDKHYLLIADVGDNTGVRKRYRLYVVEEPELGKGDNVPVAWTVPFVYPDGPHDSEAVAVDSMGERALLLTKRESPPRVFAVPLRAPSGDAPAQAEPVAKLEVSTRASGIPRSWASLYERPTSWDISPHWIAALTYARASIYERRAGEPLLDALAREPVNLDISNLGQAEALALDGDALYVTGEGEGAAILASRCLCEGCATP
jgi:hypothetical protein